MSYMNCCIVLLKYDIVFEVFRLCFNKEDKVIFQNWYILYCFHTAVTHNQRCILLQKYFQTITNTLLDLFLSLTFFSLNFSVSPSCWKTTSATGLHPSQQSTHLRGCIFASYLLMSLSISWQSRNVLMCRF